MIQAISWAMEQQVGDSTRKLLLILLADAMDQNGVCYPSQARLARLMEVSTRTVRRHIEALELEGYLVRSLRRREDGSQTSDYYLLQVPPELLTGSGEVSDREPKPSSKQRMRLRLMDHAGPACWYCGRSGSREEDPDGEIWHVDRILPGAQGGTYDVRNRALSCASCDVLKGPLTPRDWKGTRSSLDAFSVEPPSGTRAAIIEREGGGHERPPPLDAGDQGGWTPTSTLEPSEEPSEEPVTTSSEDKSSGGGAPDDKDLHDWRSEAAGIYRRRFLLDREPPDRGDDAAPWSVARALDIWNRLADRDGPETVNGAMLMLRDPRTWRESSGRNGGRPPWSDDEQVSMAVFWRRDMTPVYERCKGAWFKFEAKS